MWSLSPFLHVYRGAILSPDDRQLSCMATGPSTATNRWPLQWTAVHQERESEGERGRGRGRWSNNRVVVDVGSEDLSDRTAAINASCGMWREIVCCA